MKKIILVLIVLASFAPALHAAKKTKTFNVQKQVQQPAAQPQQPVQPQPVVPPPPTQQQTIVKPAVPAYIPPPPAQKQMSAIPVPGQDDPAAQQAVSQKKIAAPQNTAMAPESVQTSQTVISRTAAAPVKKAAPAGPTNLTSDADIQKQLREQNAPPSIVRQALKDNK